MQRDSREVNLILSAISFKSIAFVDNLFSIYANILYKDELEKNLTGVDEENQNVLYYALCNEYSEVFTLVAKVVEALDPDLLVNLLMQSDFRGVNLTMSAISFKSIAFVNHLFSLYINILDSDKLKKLLTGVDRENQNVFYYALCNEDSEVFSFVVKAVEVFDPNLLGNLLWQSDSRGVNLIMSAVSRKSIAFVKHLFSIYERELKSDKLKKLLTGVDEENQNVFYYALCNEDSEVFGIVVKVVVALSDRESWVKLLMQSDSRGVNLIMSAVSRKPIAFVKHIFSIYARKLKSDKLTKILTGVDEENLDLLSHALKSEDEKVFNFFEKKLKKRNIVIGLPKRHAGLNKLFFVFLFSFMIFVHIVLTRHSEYTKLV